MVAGENVRVAGEAPKTRITFAAEFDWRDEWPEGASELIVARVILNLRQQFFPSSRRIPREHLRSLFTLSVSVSSSTSRRLASARGNRRELNDSLLRAEIFCQFRCRCKFQFASVNICRIAPKKDFDVLAFYPPSRERARARATFAREKASVTSR